MIPRVSELCCPFAMYCFDLLKFDSKIGVIQYSVFFLFKVYVFITCNKSKRMEIITDLNQKHGSIIFKFSCNSIPTTP